MYRMCMNIESLKKMLRAFAVLEMVIVLVFVAILMAVILPRFKSLSTNWDIRQVNAETLENSMVLMDVLNANLKTAIRVTSVSDPSDGNGYIEFENNDGQIISCVLDESGFVRYGPVGDQLDLAGPFSELRFVCYGLQDMDRPTTDVDSIRFVRIEASMPGRTEFSNDRVVTGQVHIRTNGLFGTEVLP